MKYITYRNAARGGLIAERNRQTETDRQIDILITIDCIPPGVGAK